MDEVVDDRQVGGVGGAERNVVDVGCGGNREVDRSTAGLTAALGGGGGKAAPFPGDGSIDREWVEGRLDHTKALCPTRPLVGIAGEKSPEVQFRERGALMAPSTSPGSRAPIKTEVSSRTRLTRTGP